MAVVERDVEPVVNEPFLVHAPTAPDLIQQTHRAAFEHAGADASQNIVARMAFQNHTFDANRMKQLAEKQSRRSRTDDSDLGTFLCHDDRP